MMFINLNNIASLKMNGADYCCIINGISKSDVVKLLQNSNLTKGEKKSIMKIKKNKRITTIYKMCNKNITFDNKFNFHQQKTPVLI